MVLATKSSEKKTSLGTPWKQAFMVMQKTVYKQYVWVCWKLRYEQNRIIRHGNLLAAANSSSTGCPAAERDVCGHGKSLSRRRKRGVSCDRVQRLLRIAMLLEDSSGPTSDFVNNVVSSLHNLYDLNNTQIPDMQIPV